ncbi:hypothetical protein [Adhaeretor mobilis]|uniref:Uncharacterized protein n=1 Tax=Adhaeretor mobilis TaxID=1930276 RepID=A0A517MVF8_9BACT|nr:hypothetical protein [Adhaeretor mobilis]QDS98777.1 hypothetical protein HG15A2_20620 [Adhaeretor mobilis]
MACTHLKQLYRLCQEHGLHFSSSDLVRIACSECGSEETCPTVLTRALPMDNKIEAPIASVESEA